MSERDQIRDPYIWAHCLDDQWCNDDDCFIAHPAEFTCPMVRMAHMRPSGLPLYDPCTKAEPCAQHRSPNDDDRYLDREAKRASEEFLGRSPVEDLTRGPAPKGIRSACATRIMIDDFDGVVEKPGASWDELTVWLINNPRQSMQDLATLLLETFEMRRKP